MNTEKRDHTLNLFSMVGYVAKKTSVILIMAVVFALIFGAYGFVKNYNALKNKEKWADEDYRAQKIESYEKAWGDNKTKEILKLDQLFQNYSLNVSRYQTKTSYYSNSAKMFMNSEAVAKCKMSFQVICSDDQVNVDSIMASYDSNLLNQAVYDEIEEKLGEKYKAAYASELFTVYRNDGGSNTQLQIDSASTVLNITIIAIDQKDCSAIADIMKNRMEQLSSEISQKCGKHAISLIAENYVTEANAAIRELQLGRASELQTLKNSIDNATVSLSEEEKDYYELKYYDELIDQAESAENNSSYLSKKAVVIGLAAGLFLGMIWFIIKFCFDRHLRQWADMKDYYNLCVFGTALMDEKYHRYKGIRKFAADCIYGGISELSYEEQVKRIYVEMKQSIKRNGKKHILLTSTIDMKNIADQLIQLGNEEFELQYCESILKNTESYEKISEADCVVVLEKMMQSEMQSISREIELLRQSKVQILGAVLAAE